MCSMSAPIEDPLPWYDTSSDQLMCFAKPRFGVHMWELPIAPVPLPEDYKERYRIFARQLLEGKVVPALKQYVSELKAKPSAIMGRDAQPRVLSLVRAITEKRIDSLHALERVWAEDKNFLLDIYILWTASTRHKEIRKMWPPIGASSKKRKR